MLPVGLVDDFNRLFHEILEDFPLRYEYISSPSVVHPDGMIDNPMVIGIRGQMWARKSGYLLLLARNLSLRGYNVLCLSNVLDTREKKKSDIILEQMKIIRSNYNDVSNNAWTLNEDLKKEDSTYEMRSNVDDSPNECNYSVFPKVSMSRDGVSRLSLAVGEIDDNFLDLLLRPEEVDVSHGSTPLLKKFYRNTDYFDPRSKFIPNVLILDEFQFFSKKSVEALIRTAYRRYRVHIVISGLTSNYNQESFGYYKEIIHVMSHEVVLKGLCHVCNQNPALFTKRYDKKEVSKILSSESESIEYEYLEDKNHDCVEVGSEMYYVLCNVCFFNGK